MIEISIQKQLVTSEGKISLKADITIPKGETVAFYGKSGTGKTTVLRIIAGLTLPDNGTLTINGRLWFDTNKKYILPANKRPVGFVFQDYALFPNMTVKENILFAQPETDNRQLKYLMDIFGLSTLKDRKPNFLSGGQQQRVLPWPVVLHANLKFCF